MRGNGLLFRAVSLNTYFFNILWYSCWERTVHKCILKISSLAPPMYFYLILVSV